MEQGSVCLNNAAGAMARMATRRPRSSEDSVNDPNVRVWLTPTGPNVLGVFAQKYVMERALSVSSDESEAPGEANILRTTTS